MLAEHVPSPELEPEKNRSINCYLQTQKLNRS